MHRFSYDVPLAAVVASLASGPILLFLMLLYSMAISSGGVPDVPPLVGIALILVASIPCGLILGLIPNLLGASLMTFLAARFSAARSKPVWAAAGALLGMTLTFLIYRDPLFLEPYLLFGATSAGCAAICHTLIGPD